jgi:hypothetical protein
MNVSMFQTPIKASNGAGFSRNIGDTLAETLKHSGLKHLVEFPA